MEKENAVAVAHSRFMLPALTLSVFSAWLITISFQILLINIAQSFDVSVGTAGLVAAVGSVSGIAAGLLLSVLNVRFNHKLFVLAGSGFTALAALGFVLAPNFGVVLFSNIGVGTGIALASAMSYSYIGEFYPLEKRGRAIGWMVAASVLASVVGAPIVAVIVNAAGSWQSVMLWLQLPISLFALLFSVYAIPNKHPKITGATREPFLVGCKQAFANSSAMACLLVTMLTWAEGSIAFYSVSFFRAQFAIGVDLGSIVVVVGSILSAVGGVVAGLYVNRIGRKPLGTFTSLITALLTITFSFMPTFESSFLLNAARFWFAGMSSTALGALVIEQVPKFRATMTSLNTAFMNIGMLLASVCAGIALNLYNYQTMAVILGSLGIGGTILWVALVKDTSKN